MAESKEIRITVVSNAGGPSGAAPSSSATPPPPSTAAPPPTSTPPPASHTAEEPDVTPEQAKAVEQKTKTRRKKTSKPRKRKKEAESPSEEAEGEGLDDASLTQAAEDDKISEPESWPWNDDNLTDAEKMHFGKLSAKANKKSEQFEARQKTDQEKKEAKEKAAKEKEDLRLSRIAHKTEKENLEWEAKESKKREAMGEGFQRQFEDRFSNVSWERRQKGDDFRKKFKEADEEIAGEQREASLAGKASTLTALSSVGTVLALEFAALAAATSAVVIGMKQVDEVMKGLIRSASNFHGPLAATVATVQVERLQSEMQRAEELGPDLNEYARLRGDISLAMDEAITAALKPLLPLVNDVAADIADIARGVSYMFQSDAYRQVVEEIRNISTGIGVMEDFLNGVASNPLAKGLMSQIGLDIPYTILKLLKEIGENTRKAPPPGILLDQAALLDGRITPGLTFPTIPVRPRGVSFTSP